jgi:cell division septal protein FtsQ
MRILLIRLGTSAVLGILIVACFHAYSYLTTSDKLAVADVEIHGLSRLGSSEMNHIVEDLRGQNILLVGLEDYAARFARHPRIENAELRKVLPNKVVCTLREREPVALVYTNQFLEVDEEGMVMDADGLSGQLDLPIITGLDRGAVTEGRPCSDARLIGVLAILDFCKRYGGQFAETISELRVGESGISIVSLEEGVVLLLGQSEFENRLKKFFLMKNTIAQRNETARLIDLRFEDQIVLRSGI